MPSTTASSPAGTLRALRNLGVARAIELPTIGAVAVTAALPVVDLIDTLPAVAAVEPQRRLVSHLNASKKQIHAIGLHKRATSTTWIGGKRVTATRPGLTGRGVTVAVLDSGIFAGGSDRRARAPGGRLPLAAWDLGFLVVLLQLVWTSAAGVTLMRVSRRH